MSYIFHYVKSLDVDYVLEVEEDWMLNRPLSLSDMANVLEENDHLVQMRIPRVVWYAPYHSLDIVAGSLLLHHINIPNTTYSKQKSWYEWRGDFYFWSHNPNLFSKKMLEEDYSLSDSGDHEKSFGKNLLSKYPDASIGFWATNPYDAYITHIGIRDQSLLDRMPPHPQEQEVETNCLPEEMLSLKIGVVIPWREQPTRVQPFQLLLSWYQKNLPQAEIFLADRPGRIWQPSGTRNDGVDMARAAGCDIIVMNDADTFPEREPLIQAIISASKDNFIHIPYKEYRVLDRNGTRDFYNGSPIKYCTAKVVESACSGVNVFAPFAWERLGGMDEKFRGWGYEDSAMHLVHQVVHGKEYVSHSGVATAMDHEHQSKSDNNFVKNRRLYREYGQKRNEKDIIALVKQGRV